MNKNMKQNMKQNCGVVIDIIHNVRVIEIFWNGEEKKYKEKDIKQVNYRKGKMQTEEIDSLEMKDGTTYVVHPHLSVTPIILI